MTNNKRHFVRRRGNWYEFLNREEYNMFINLVKNGNLYQSQHNPLNVYRKRVVNVGCGSFEKWIKVKHPFGDPTNGTRR